MLYPCLCNPQIPDRSHAVSVKSSRAANGDGKPTYPDDAILYISDDAPTDTAEGAFPFMQAPCHRYKWDQIFKKIPKAKKEQMWLDKVALYSHTEETSADALSEAIIRHKGTLPAGKRCRKKGRSELCLCR